MKLAKRLMWTLYRSKSSDCVCLDQGEDIGGWASGVGSCPREEVNVSSQQPGAWFDYLVRVQPHHTDYAGVVWHGSYLQWMEEARIAAFREVGIEFADLVQLGCDLPVTELSIQYHQPLTMGTIAVVKSRLRGKTKVRMHWDQQIYAPEVPHPCVTATLTLVPVDRAKARIIRKLPDNVKEAIAQIMAPSRDA